MLVTRAQSQANANKMAMDEKKFSDPDGMA